MAFLHVCLLSRCRCWEGGRRCRRRSELSAATVDLLPLQGAGPPLAAPGGSSFSWRGGSSFSWRGTTATADGEGAALRSPSLLGFFLHLLLPGGISPSRREVLAYIGWDQLE
jgi:hypothetical protein